MLTDLSFVQPGVKWPPDDSDTVRFKALLERNKQLFEAMHEQVLRLRQILLRSNDLDKDTKLEITLILNWFKRLSTLWADMLWGEAPKIRAGEAESAEQAFLEQLVAGNDLHNRGHEVTIDQSRFGIGLWKVRYDGQRVIVESQTPSVWYPVVAPDNVKEVTAHVLAWEYEVKEDNNRKSRRLQVEIHTAGKVERHLYRLSSSKIGDEIPPANPLGRDEAITGVDDCLVVLVPNVTTSDRVIGYDDYTDCISLVQALEALLSQVAAIIQKHADPKLAAPSSAFHVDPETGQRGVKIAGPQALEIDDGDPDPKYLVWDAQLTAAVQQKDALMEQLYTLSETSPAAFGQLKAGLAESGSALRRLLAACLIKVNRLRNRQDPAVKKVLKLASRLAVERGVKGAVELIDVRIDWQDGLPQDTTEAVNQESTAFTAGLTSRESALKRLYGLEGQALQDEIARIEEEEEAKAPPLPTFSQQTAGQVE